ncbi:TIGR03862 family flavoprotein [Burkholderiaceae bacterium UC74_6]
MVDAVVVIGGGPAGLMAAEVLSGAGVAVDLYDAMPSVGRKFLLAGKGGLNLTHSEEFAPFLSRFGDRAAQIEPMLRGFDGPALRAWAGQLGIETFVGTSGRVFPKDLKAAPLLRAWLHRLRDRGVRFHMRSRWLGWSEGGALRMQSPDGESELTPRATVLALGGASWPQLGSTGAWVPWLEAQGVEVAPLRSANCGFDVAGWTPLFAEKFAGLPVKPVALSVGDQFRRKGEFVITATGIEGSLVYAASSLIRETIAREGECRITLDLLPDHTTEHVVAEVARGRGSRSMSTHLKSRLGIEGLKSGLLHELLSKSEYQDVNKLGAALKALPITLVLARPVAEVISTAGGVRFEALDEQLMVHSRPGLFCAGEMLDWEAPTGGYLLTASMASGRVAGQGVLDFLARG